MATSPPTEAIARLTQCLQAIMADLADLLDADQFNNIEARVLAAGVPYPPLGTDPRRAPEPAAGQPPKLYRLIPKFDPFMYQEFPTALWDLILIPQSPETKDGGA